MANTSMLQVRTNAADRERAAQILESLGTNISAVVNMLLKQIIITESIPFEVKLTHPAYTIEQEVEEIRATMAMENMSLTDEETQMLMDYANGRVSGDELRKRIFDSITDEDDCGAKRSPLYRLLHNLMAESHCRTPGGGCIVIVVP